VVRIHSPRPLLSSVYRRRVPRKPTLIALPDEKIDRREVHPRRRFLCRAVGMRVDEAEGRSPAPSCKQIRTYIKACFGYAAGLLSQHRLVTMSSHGFSPSGVFRDRPTA
jgi:hypothetical protein